MVGFCRTLNLPTSIWDNYYYNYYYFHHRLTMIEYYSNLKTNKKNQFIKQDTYHEVIQVNWLIIIKYAPKQVFCFDWTGLLLTWFSSWIVTIGDHVNFILFIKSSTILQAGYRADRNVVFLNKQVSQHTVLQHTAMSASFVYHVNMFAAPRSIKYFIHSFSIIQ